MSLGVETVDEERAGVDLESVEWMEWERMA
jgi:hypothetical protein